MKKRIQQYLGNRTWLLVRGSLLLLILPFIFVPRSFAPLKEWYLQYLCGADASQFDCGYSFQYNLFGPIADAALPMIIVLTLLAALPAWLLRKWVRQLSWWLLPFCLLSVLTAPNAGGFFDTSYRAVAQRSAWLLLIVTALFVIGHFAYILARWNVDGPGARNNKQVEKYGD